MIYYRGNSGACSRSAAALLVVLASGCGRPPSTPPKPSVTSMLKVTESTIDLGIVTPGDKPSVEFCLKNTGTKTEKVTDMRTSCGCSPATIDSREILPGEQTFVRLSFDAGKKPGNRTHAVFLTTENTGAREMVLFARADVKWPIEIHPRELVLDSSLIGETIQRDIEVFSPIGEDFEVVSVEPSVPWISASIKPLKDRAIRLAFSISPQSTGRFDEAFVIHTNSNVRPKLMGRIKGEAGDGVRVNPASVWLGVVPPHSTKTLRFTVRKAAGEPDTASVSVASDTWNCGQPETHIADDLVVVEIPVHLPASAGNHTGTLDLTFRASDSYKGVAKSVKVACIVSGATDTLHREGHVETK